MCMHAQMLANMLVCLRTFTSLLVHTGYTHKNQFAYSVSIHTYMFGLQDMLSLVTVNTHILAFFPLLY